MYIPLPDDQSRMAILNAVLRELPAVNDLNSSLLAKTGGFSGAVLTKICQHAYQLAIKESIKNKQRRTRKTAINNDEPVPVLKIHCGHFEEAITFARRSVNNNDIRKYEIFAGILRQDIHGDSKG
jgi:transitional endoplasmic reticulum ATPase